MSQAPEAALVLNLKGTCKFLALNIQCFVVKQFVATFLRSLGVKFREL